MTKFVDTMKIIFDRLESEIRENARLQESIRQHAKMATDQDYTIKALRGDLAVARQELDSVIKQRNALSAAVDQHTAELPKLARLYEAAEKFVIFVNRGKTSAAVRDAGNILQSALRAAYHACDQIPF